MQSNNPWIVIGSIAAILIVMTYLYPSEVGKVEHEAVVQAGKLAHKAYEAEQDVVDWWKKEDGRKKSGSEEEGIVPPNEATLRMLQHSSKWVDGEKKLKDKLKLLAERQAQGKDIGVPVLTRWLGDDIPAWAGEGVDVEEWKKKVADKYAEMREQEVKWKKLVYGLVHEQSEKA